MMQKFRWIYASVSFLLLGVLIALGYFFFDRPVAFFCRALDQRIIDVFQWITVLGVATGYLIGFFILFLFFRFVVHRRRYARQALFLFVSTAAAGITTDIVKFIVGRYRPKMLFEQNLYGMDPFRIGYEYTSFPAGHATTVFATAMALALIFPKWRLLFFSFALIVAASRVIIGAHYLGDVLAGIYIGVVTVFIVAWAGRRYTRRNSAGY